MNRTINQISSGASLGAMTAAEIAAGRYLRAPDHDAGTAAGGSDGGSSDGNGGAGGEGAAGGDAAAAGAGGAAGSDAGGAGAGAGSDKDGAAGGDGKPAGDGDGGTILGDAAKAGDDAAGGDGDGAADGDKGEGEAGKEGEGEGPRLTFGEGEAAVAILGAPEAYEVKAPEGMEFDKAAFDVVEPVLRDLNLSNEAAQAVVTAYGEKIIPMIEERAKAAGEALGADMRRTWTEESQAAFDGKEGRPTFDEAKALSRQAFLKFGVAGKEDHPFLQLLEDSGLGSHPAMLAFVSNIGRAVGESAIDPGRGGAQPQRLADRVYGQPIPREG